MEHDLSHVPEENRWLVNEAVHSIIDAFTSDLPRAPDMDRCKAEVVDDSIIARFNEEEEAWHDFLELKRADYIAPGVWRDNPSGFSKLRREVSAFLEGVEGELRIRLIEEGLSEDKAERVCGLMSDVVTARARFGTSLEFWEQVYACLSEGLIPVRWSGQWPEGKMLVVTAAGAAK